MTNERCRTSIIDQIFSKMTQMGLPATDEIESIHVDEFFSDTVIRGRMSFYSTSTSAPYEIGYLAVIKPDKYLNDRVLVVDISTVPETYSKYTR